MVNTGLLDHPTDALKTASNRAIPKIVEATSDLIGNKIRDKSQNNSETYQKKFNISANLNKKIHRFQTVLR